MKKEKRKVVVKRKNIINNNKSTLHVFLTNKIVLITILVVMLIRIVVVGSYLYYNNYYNLTSEERSEQAVKRLSKIYNIPNDNPAVALVSNADEQRKSNPDFYKDALNNDYLVIFKEKNIGILYRESEDKIINIGFIASE